MSNQRVNDMSNKNYNNYSIAKKTCWAIDEDPKKPGKVKIIDQEHAAELLEMAKDYLA